jgi:transposase
MPRPISLQRRKRVVELISDGATYKETAARLGISETSVHRFLRQWRETADLGAAPGHPGMYPGKLSDRHANWLRDRITQQPDISLGRLQVLCAKRGVSISRQALNMKLRKLGLRKKSADKVDGPPASLRSAAKPFELDLTRS